MTTIDPPDGAKTNVIADPTPPTSAKPEVVVDLNPALVSAETEVELPEPQVIVEPNPPLVGAEIEVQLPETQGIELDPPPAGAQSDPIVDLASVDRSAFIPAIPLSDLVGDPELSDVTIWQVAKLFNAFAAKASQTR